MRPARLELDYIAPPRRPAWPGVALLSVAIAAAALLQARYLETMQDLSAIVSAEGLLPAQGRRASGPRDARAGDALRDTEHVLRQLALPWGALLEAVEAASTDDVAVLSMQPDAAQRVLRLTAEARHREAMFIYAGRLAAAPVLAEVHLVSHQVQREDPQQPLRFAIRAALRSAP